MPTESNKPPQKNPNAATASGDLKLLWEAILRMNSITRTEGADEWKVKDAAENDSFTIRVTRLQIDHINYVDWLFHRGLPTTTQPCLRIRVAIDYPEAGMPDPDVGIVKKLAPFVKRAAIHLDASEPMPTYTSWRHWVWSKLADYHPWPSPTPYPFEGGRRFYPAIHWAANPIDEERVFISEHNLSVWSPVHPTQYLNKPGLPQAFCLTFRWNDTTPELHTGWCLRPDYPEEDKDQIEKSIEIVEAELSRIE